MNIKNQLLNETKEFAETWNNKRQVGFIRYFAIGSLRCALFFFFMYLVQFLIEWQVQFDKENMISIIISSILLPTLSWSINEFRYKRIKRKK